MSSLQDRIRKYLLNHPDLAVNVVSQFYPLKKADLLKYSNKLAWCRVCLNEKLVWNEKLLEEFKDKIKLYWLAENKTFPWTDEFIDKHLMDLFYCIDEDISKSSIGNNTSLPWSADFIEKYKEHWNWMDLSCNESIPFTKELLEQFNGYWHVFLTSNKRILSDPELMVYLDIYDDRSHSCEYCGKDMDYITQNSLVTFMEMFTCPNFIWDFYLFQRIKDLMDDKKIKPDVLYYFFENDNFPWDFKIIELFEPYWNYFYMENTDAIGSCLAKVVMETESFEYIVTNLPDFVEKTYELRFSSDDEDPTGEDEEI